MEERLPRTEEVVGSNPICSKRAGFIPAFLFLFYHQRGQNAIKGGCGPDVT